MLAPSQSFSESYSADAGSVTRARTDLASFAEDRGARGSKLDAIRLAASEAVTNAVLHAYSEEDPGTVQVNASYVEDELWLLVADSGRGLRAHSRRPGLGLGLALIAQLVDDFQIHSRATGGTELQMRFKLDSRRRDPSGPRAQLRGSFSSAVSPA